MSIIDIVRKLRDAANFSLFDRDAFSEAADELERLTKENAEAFQTIKNMVARLNGWEASAIEFSDEIELLRTALEHIADCDNAKLPCIVNYAEIARAALDNAKSAEQQPDSDAQTK